MNSIKNRLWVGCQIAALVMVFSAPISRALFNLSAAVFLLLWFLSGDLIAKIHLIFQHPITKPVLVFVALMLAGVSYTVAPADDVIESLRVYSKFFLILMFLTVFAEPVWRNRAVWAFMGALALTVLLTYTNIWFDPVWSRTANQGLGVDHSVFTDYIVQGVATAMFIGMCAFKAFDESSAALKAVWFVLAAAAVFSLLFLLQGRSGQFVLASVVFLVVVRELSPRHRLMALAGALACIVGLVYFSPLMADRNQLMLSDIMMFLQGEKHTSVGLRMQMWQFSFNAMLDSPWVGHGTGAYRSMAEQFFGHCDFTCFHPHNQYLFFGIEHGVTGLLVYLWILLIMLVSARNMGRMDASLMLLLVVVLVVNGLANAPLWYRMESYIFYTLLGVVLSAYRRPAISNA